MTNSTTTIGPIRIGDIGYYAELQARDNARFIAIWEQIHDLYAFRESRGTLGKGLDRQIDTLRNELNNLSIQTPNS